MCNNICENQTKRERLTKISQMPNEENQLDLPKKPNKELAQWLKG